MCCFHGQLADHCVPVARWRRSSALKFVKGNAALFLGQGVNAVAAESDLNFDCLADQSRERVAPADFRATEHLACAPPVRKHNLGCTKANQRGAVLSQLNRQLGIACHQMASGGGCIAAEGKPQRRTAFHDPHWLGHNAAQYRWVGVSKTSDGMNATFCARDGIVTHVDTTGRCHAIVRPIAATVIVEQCAIID